MTTYLFDSVGNWIAFRRGQFVFTPTGSWLGWLGDSNDIFDADGEYLGTIVADRLFRSLHPADWRNTEHPGYPGREVPADHPGYPGRFETPIGMEDVQLFEHA